jgi:HEAT repeat protein
MNIDTVQQKLNRLRGFLHNPDYHMRLRGVSSLASLHDPRTIDLLIEILGDFDEKDEESKVNRAASAALAHLGEASVLPLIAVVAQEGGWKGYWATQALGYIGDKRAVEALIEALQDGDSHVQEGSVEALGQIGDKRALLPLHQALQTAKGYLIVAIREAVQRIEK